MKTAIIRRRCPIRFAAAFVAIAMASSAFAQTMQFYPLRSAPLGSPVGTIGEPVTPQFNAGLGCWEVQVAPGVEVDIDLQAFGWGDAPGSPIVGAMQGTVVSAGYDNGFGGVLNPKGWPESPFDGAYQARSSCEGGGGNGLPCVFPFDLTCGQQGGGTCVTPSPRWIWQGNPGLPAIAAPTLNYGWATEEGASGEVDDGTVRTFGGLILEVPLNAAGTYVIALNPDPNTSFMSNITGAPIPDVALTSACITVIDDGEPGRCCSDIGPNVVCEEVTALFCSIRPEPRLFAHGETCDGACACPTCLSDTDCDDGDDCTSDTCDECGQCVHTSSCPGISFYPIRMAHLGSPAGTVGYSVTPEFNTELGCWEVEVLPGFEVDIDVQVFNWGSTPGSPALGAVGATTPGVTFSSGVGPDVVPKGWPDNPEFGAYMGTHVCIEGGNGNPCVPPFGDYTCDNSNGTCGHNPDFVMPECTNALSAFSTNSGGYAWYSAVQVDCNVDDGQIKTLGGLILEVPYDAQGTYLIDFNTELNSFMSRWSGKPIENVQFTPACITVAAPEPLKNRYLTFVPREAGPVAYKLDMVSSLFHPDAIVSGWIGAPDANGIASLEPAPVTRDWTEQVIHITGCEIAPVAEFELRASDDGGATFLPPLPLKTADQPTQSRWWGDVAGFFNGNYWTPPQGVTNIADAGAIRNKFEGQLHAPSLSRADVSPQVPNRIANIEDVFFAILAFQGNPYPFGCPDDPCHDKLVSPCP